jgi:hypothetical protein
MTDLTTTGTPMDALDPRQRLAVELYTNPLFGRTFGNKLASATKAGFSDGRAFDSRVMQAAIKWTLAEKLEQSRGVADYLKAFSMDAARKLVEQVGISEGLEPHPMPEGLLDKPPTPIIGTDKDGNEKVIGYDDGHLKQASAITQANKAAAALAKEAREALKLILAYHMGTPEQHVRLKGGKPTEDPLDLGALTDDQLKELARHVQEVRESKAAIRVLPPPEEDE